MAPNVTLAPINSGPRPRADRGQRKIKALRRVYRGAGGPNLSGAAISLANELGFVDISTVANPELVEYIKKAAQYQEFALRWLAEHVGRGQCGPMPASIVATAALQLAASRFAFEKLGKIALFARLGDQSARNLVLAHELCAREAALKPAEGPHALLAALVPEYADSASPSKQSKAATASRVPSKPTDNLATNGSLAGSEPIEAAGEALEEPGHAPAPPPSPTPAEGGTPSMAIDPSPR